jgi:hypothetical protein
MSAYIDASKEENQDILMQAKLAFIINGIYLASFALRIISLDYCKV